MGRAGLHKVMSTMAVGVDTGLGIWKDAFQRYPIIMHYGCQDSRFAGGLLN